MSVPAIFYLSLEPLREGHASYTHVIEIIEGLRAKGSPVRLFAPSYGMGVLPGALRRLLGIAWATLRFMMAGRAGVFYARWHFAAFPAMVWAKLCGMKIVIEVNGPEQDLFIAWPWMRRFGGLFSWLMDVQLHRADAIIGVTPGLLNYALEKCSGRSKPMGAVIPNGANTDIFCPNLPRPGGLPDHYAVFAGTLAPWQGIQTILAAMEHSDWPQDLHLVVAGDGVLRADVEAAATQDERVHYLGRLPYRQLPPVIANAAVGLVVTLNVAGRADTGVSPLKMFENLACGIPVVVSDVPGLRDMVHKKGGVGVLIPPNDPAALSAALAKLLADPARARAMGMAGAAWVKAEQSWAVRVGDTYAVINKILS